MLLTRKRNTPALSDLADLSWFPIFGPMIRIEDRIEEGRYVVRAEIPGVDPAKDVAVTAGNGNLRLAVVRLNWSRQGSRTEFHYGTFHRTIVLPNGAQEDSINASYADGILQITMDVVVPDPTGRAIPIAISRPSDKPETT